MKIIKLNAIDSTNSFLKQLAAEEEVENFTIVTAQHQMNGRGQRGSKWIIEKDKNLTFSVLYNNDDIKNMSIFTMNIVVAISVVEGLQLDNILNFAIKWPNDILADNKKIAGILIENSIKSQCKIQSIIGIGVNVNQEKFDNLPQASSLFILGHESIDKDTLLKNIVLRLQFNLNLLKNTSEDYFWNLYHLYLFKREIVSTFEDTEGNRFIGKIIKVTKEGRLQVELENESRVDFDIKEIKMLY